MFKISNVKTRFYEFENPDSGRVLHIEPPKLKTLRCLERLATQKDVSIEEMAGQIARVVSKNRERFQVSGDKIMEWMNVDQLGAFLKDFISWLNNEKTNDPN